MIKIDKQIVGVAVRRADEVVVPPLLKYERPDKVRGGDI